MQKRSLIIIADIHPATETMSPVRSISSNLCTSLMKDGCTIDLIDLYMESKKNVDNIVYTQDMRSERTVDYQIRVKQADCLVFLYESVWSGMPAIMKGFIDTVFQPGFAYTDSEQYLCDKQVCIGILEPQTRVESQLFNANREEVFWNRQFLRTTGMKGVIRTYYNIHRQNEHQRKKTYNSLFHSFKNLLLSSVKSR